MKKLIAISVMLALVAGAVFAETSISGGVETHFQIGQTGDKKPDGSGGWKDADPTMKGNIANAKISLSGSNDDGTLGGKFRFNADQSDPRGWMGSAGKYSQVFWDQVYVWWKPIDQVKIFLGIDQDGLFDTADFLGWGFHKGDNDYLFNHHWGLWRQIFPGNWDGYGLAFSFYLVDGLDINLVLPTGGVNYHQGGQDVVTQEDPISDTSTGGVSNNDGMLPGRLELTANYSLDFGKISFVYKGKTITKEAGDALGGFSLDNGTTNHGAFSIDAKNNGTIGASVLVTAIDSIQIKAGGSIILNDTSDNIINAGLGVAWAGDAFGVNARFGFVSQGKKGADRQFITVNVMPIINVGENGQVLVDIGITNDSFKHPSYKANPVTGDDGSALGWSVTPAYRLNVPGGAFKIGLQVWNNVTMGGNATVSGQEYVKWNIPMSLSFNF